MAHPAIVKGFTPGKPSSAMARSRSISEDHLARDRVVRREGGHARIRVLVPKVTFPRQKETPCHKALSELRWNNATRRNVGSHRRYYEDNGRWHRAGTRINRL